MDSERKMKIKEANEVKRNSVTHCKNEQLYWSHLKDEMEDKFNSKIELLCVDIFCAINNKIQK